ncbi:MAG: thioredoxin [Symploca sp. SIO2E9]|nr:thioredoxin [Symploca sp. SIO2E9]
MSSTVWITDAEFEIEVLEAQQPVLVYFWAPWCGPCRLVSPSVDWVADTYSDRLKVIKMEVDANPNARSKCKVEGVPALRLFKKGEVTKSHEGAITKKALEQMLAPDLE